jgi:hypothetical protein
MHFADAAAAFKQELVAVVKMEAVAIAELQSRPNRRHTEPPSLAEGL